MKGKACLVGGKGKGVLVFWQKEGGMYCVSKGKGEYVLVRKGRSGAYNEGISGWG